MIRLLKHKLKIYKKAAFNKKEYINRYYIDEKDNAVIRVKIDGLSEIYSTFSVDGFEELSSEFKEYIDDVIYHISLIHPVILEFYTSNLSKLDQEKLKSKITSYYGLVLEDKKQDLKINLITLVGLFLVGCSLLLFSYYLVSNNKGQLFIDFINIAGTFSLWEMVDLYLLDRKNKQVELWNAAQTATAKIIFK